MTPPASTAPFTSWPPKWQGWSTARRSCRMDDYGDSMALANCGCPDARHIIIRGVAPCREQEIWGKPESHLGNLRPVWKIHWSWRKELSGKRTAFLVHRLCLPSFYMEGIKYAFMLAHERKGEVRWLSPPGKRGAEEGGVGHLITLISNYHSWHQMEVRSAKFPKKQRGGVLCTTGCRCVEHLAERHCRWDSLYGCRRRWDRFME